MLVFLIERLCIVFRINFMLMIAENRLRNIIKRALENKHNIINFRYYKKKGFLSVFLH